MGQVRAAVRREGKLIDAGSWWVAHIVSPSFRCHHRSGSSKRVEHIQKTRNVRPATSIAGNERCVLQETRRRACRTRDLTERGER